MPIFRMKCSICDETFDLDRLAVPLREAAPQHLSVHEREPEIKVPCLGSGKGMIQPAR